MFYLLIVKHNVWQPDMFCRYSQHIYSFVVRRLPSQTIINPLLREELYSCDGGIQTRQQNNHYDGVKAVVFVDCKSMLLWVLLPGLTRHLWSWSALVHSAGEDREKSCSILLQQCTVSKSPCIWLQVAFDKNSCVWCECCYLGTISPHKLIYLFIYFPLRIWFETEGTLWPPGAQ